MTKSFCIKVNNEKIINYLLSKYENLEYQNNIKYSIKSFKHYKNIIIHYYGDNLDVFYSDLAQILSNCISLFYESNFIKRKIFSNYFYFIDIEQEKILNIISDFLLPTTKEYKLKQNYIFSSVYEYISNNKSMILQGFFYFRLKEYINFIDYIIDLSVNSFLLEKEYFEFVNLLKLYIKSEESKIEEIHLIYKNKKAIVLDSNLNSVTLDDNIFKTPYLSDITFSNNDFALNTLLNLLPEKINIHLIDSEDEFIKTLKLIFENKVYICKNCSICNLYKYKRSILKT